jgi:hypothetical protein
VKETCFCVSETLVPGWETNIDNYKNAYKALNISVTPKDSLILLIEVHYLAHQIQQPIAKQQIQFFTIQNIFYKSGLFVCLLLFLINNNLNG